MRTLLNRWHALVLVAWLSPASLWANTVAAGADHSAVVTPDGAVWTFGDNGSGQLGDGTTTVRKTPTQVPGLTGAVAVAAGAYYTLVLKSDGSVWGFGDNIYGELGDGTTTTRRSPVQALTLVNVVAIAAGRNHALALTSGGELWAWGRNTNGQLGNGSTVQSTQPVLVGVGYSAIAAGGSHSVAVKTDGTVWAWGLNFYGQLGDGTTTQRTAPVQMSGVTGATSVAAGAEHSVILKSDGTVRATGRNDGGRLGDGTQTQRTTPVTVAALSGATAVSAGAEHSAAVKSDGTVWSWGVNTSGQLGDGTFTNRLTAVAALGLSAVTTLATGEYHSVAVSSGGTVWTWGTNGSGRLGDGTVRGRPAPISISGPGYAWKVATPSLSANGGTYYIEPTVTITVATAGAQIHYTTDGSTPTELDPTVASGGAVSVTRSLTLKVAAFKTGMPASNVAIETYTLVVSQVSISPGSGTYTSARTVTLSTSTTNATIRYTTNGSTPSESSSAYSGAFTVATSSTVKAIAYRTDWTPSTESSATLTMNFGTLAAPAVSPAAGSYVTSVTVSVTAMSGATIRYTTTGTDPTATSPVYWEPLVLSQTTTLKVRAYHPDYTVSPVTTAAYTIQAAAPVFNPAPGPYAAGTALTLTTSTPGATIAYTLNGADPTAADPAIASGATIIIGSYTLKAKAFKSGMVASDTTTGTYTATGSSASAKVISAGQHAHALRPDGVAWGWGYNPSGQLGDGTVTTRLQPRAMAGVTGAVSLNAGPDHSLLVLSTGGVLAVGSNTNGKLGDGTTTSRLYPVAVSGLSNVVDVAAGSGHSVARTSAGAVYAWGGGGYVGDGTSTQRTTPVPLSGLSSGVVGISAGDSHTLAVLNDGTVRAWGANGNAQLGDGTLTARTAPVLVSSLTDIVAVAAGTTHSLALRANGTVVAWGTNTSGQLGDGTRAQRTTPVAVSGLTSVIGIAAGGGHSLALTADGTVWSWGSGTTGALGDGGTSDRLVPAPIPGLTNIVQVAAGSGHSMALSSDLTVWLWGRNDFGQLGDGTTVTRLRPVAISGPGMAWKVATPVLSSAGGQFGTTQSVTVTCSDPDAALYYTLNGADPTPADAQVMSGGAVVIGVSSTLKVAGWKTGVPSSAVASATFELKVPVPAVTPQTGRYTSAQTVTVTSTSGAETRYTLDGTQPGAASPLYSAPFQVAGSLTVNARAFKTGWTPSDSVAQSYWIDEGIVAAPAIAPGGGSFAAPPLVRLASTDPDVTIRFTVDGADPTAASPLYRYPFELALTTTVKARAFRAGWASSPVTAATYVIQAANAADAPTVSPAGGTFATQQVVTVTSATGATLRYTTTGLDPTAGDQAIATGSTVVVDRSQVLKVRAFASGLDPSPVRRADYVVLGALAIGERHGLALTANGTVWGWGRNDNGQVGVPGQAWHLTPQSVMSGVVAVAAGSFHSLAVKADGTVWAWGQNLYGQLGIGTTTQQLSPVQVPGLANVTAVAAGVTHSLALKSDGTVWAWGSNGSGELGDGTTTSRLAPVQVVGLSGVASIAAASQLSLAAQANGGDAGRVWSWGSNASGQLGDGSALSRMVPVRVPGLTRVRVVSAGQRWAMALKDDGTVWSWGENSVGQLGAGLPVSAISSVPVRVQPLTNVRQISAGRYHALAVDGDGWLWGWGRDQGELGPTTDLGTSPVPKRLMAPLAPTLIAGGGSSTHIARTDGTVWAMGFNGDAQLGDGTQTGSTQLVPVSGLTLATNSWLTGDPDGDGVTTWREYLRGLDPLRSDSNDDGVSDAIADSAQGAAANPDYDADGVSNAQELLNGSDPFTADTDGDGVPDGADAFPTDPTRSSVPAPTPGDTTPPVITLTQPTGARPR